MAKRQDILAQFSAAIVATDIVTSTMLQVEGPSTTSLRRNETHPT